MIGPLLEVTNLSSHYGRIQALKGVSLSVGQGQLVALVGANGAGKTTFLRSVSGVQRTTGGNIRFAREDITQIRPDKRVKLGICQVPEGPRYSDPCPSRTICAWAPICVPTRPRSPRIWSACTPCSPY